MTSNTHGFVAWQGDDGLEYQLSLKDNIITFEAQAITSSIMCFKSDKNSQAIFDELFGIVVGTAPNKTETIRNKMKEFLDSINPL